MTEGVCLRCHPPAGDHRGHGHHRHGSHSRLYSHSGHSGRRLGGHGGHHITSSGGGHGSSHSSNTGGHSSRSGGLTAGSNNSSSSRSGGLTTTSGGHSHGHGGGSSLGGLTYRHDDAAAVAGGERQKCAVIRRRVRLCRCRGGPCSSAVSSGPCSTGGERRRSWRQPRRPRQSEATHLDCRCLGGQLWLVVAWTRRPAVVVQHRQRQS